MNFIETRNEYTIMLVNVLSPLIYEGIDSIYKDTVDLKSSNHSNKILKMFQQFIKKIPNWNENIVRLETNRILTQSKCEYLLDLIKAVIKANIILLSNSNIETNLKVDENHLDINLENFIHYCYIECARQFYNMPYLFSKSFKPIDRKKNQKECMHIIDLCIRETIRKNLPVDNILKKYLYQESFDNKKEDYMSNLISEENKSISKKKISTFINPNVIDNFKSSDYSHSLSESDDDCDDKETANLINDIREKFNSGNLLKNVENKVDKYIYHNNNNELVSEGLQNHSNDRNISIAKDSREKSITKVSESKISYSSGTPIRFSEREKNIQTTKKLDEENIGEQMQENKSEKMQEIKSNNSSSENNIAEKINEALSQIKEDSNGINDSISYRIDHDSEYEAVFSNLNDNNDATNKKKRKDEYFSKFNNI